MIKMSAEAWVASEIPLLPGQVGAVDGSSPLIAKIGDGSTVFRMLPPLLGLPPATKVVSVQAGSVYADGVFFATLRELQGRQDDPYGHSGGGGGGGSPGVVPNIQMNAQSVAPDMPAGVQRSGPDDAPRFLLSIPRGAKGEQGDPGQAATVSVASTNTVAAGQQASVQMGGTPQARTLTFNIPRGADGAKGEQGNPGVTPSFKVGTVETLDPGQAATVAVSGSATEVTLNFGIPKGEKGATGGGGAGGTPIVPSIQVQAQSVEAGQPAAVQRSGSDEAPRFLFSIPKGADGAKGEQGDPGQAATVSVAGTNTVAAGQQASVQMGGTPQARTLTFNIPKGADGAKGEQGDPGQAATVSVAGTNTVAAGQQASVQMGGTPQARTLTFNIPRGADGAKGEQGDPGAPGVTPTISAAVEMIESGEATVERSGSDTNMTFLFKLPKAEGDGANVDGMVRLPKSDPSAPVIDYANTQPQNSWRDGVEVDKWGRPLDEPAVWAVGHSTYTESPTSDPDNNDAEDQFFLRCTGTLKSATTYLAEGYFRFSPSQQYSPYAEYYIGRYFKNAVRADGGRQSTGLPVLDNRFNNFLTINNTIEDGLLAAEWWINGFSNSSNVNSLLFKTTKALDLDFHNTATGERYPSVTLAALRVCRHALIAQPIGVIKSSDYEVMQSGVFAVMASNGPVTTVLVLNRRNTPVQFSANNPKLAHTGATMRTRQAVCKHIFAPNDRWKNDADNYDIQVVTTYQQVKITKAGTAMQLVAPARSVIAMRF